MRRQHRAGQMSRLLPLQGFMIELLLFAAVSKGCNGPSAPQCFRTPSDSTLYMCKWTTPFSQLPHVIHIRHESKSKEYPAEERNQLEIPEEFLFSKKSPVDIWVEPANMSDCASQKTRVTLEDTIKYETPQNVSVSWSRDNLTIRWTAPETSPAAVEIWHRADSLKAWNEIRGNTTVPTHNKYSVTMVILEKLSAQQLWMRHRSTTAKNPLWSDGAKILTLPIEFIRDSKTLNTKTAAKLKRTVTLRWKPVPGAVFYQVETHSSKGCRCHKQQGNTSRTFYSTVGSYAAVNIMVRAVNAASSSPRALHHVRPENPPDLKLCNGTALSSKTSRSYSEWYELRDGKVKEETVIILTSHKKSVKDKIEEELKEFLPYIYFEHHCNKRVSYTQKMCLYYKKQGQPLSPPRHLSPSAESPDSAALSWEPISMEEQRGLLTHYTLCIQSSLEARADCRNISSSLRSYTLEGLTPSTKYNISLTGVTAAGDGPKARVVINTPPGKPYNVGLSFGLLVGFFVFSTSCTFIFTRLKKQVLPPVPTPMIPGFTTIQAEVQDLLERKEEMHNVTLVQFHPERCPLEDEVKGGTRDSSHLEDEEDEEDGGRSLTGSEDDKQTTSEEATDPDRVQREIALLIYRNGLVFDVNADSS